MHPPPGPSSRAHQVLRQAWATGAFHHAHLLTGDLATARHLAMALAADFNCEASAAAGAGELPQACGACAACERISHGTHPDVVIVTGEGASGAIPIEAVRTISASMALPPHEARARVIVIVDAAALLGAAANALLKTLEEPPARTIFVLCARSQHSVMPTIRSRCQRHVIATPLDAALGAAAPGTDDTLLTDLDALMRTRDLGAVAEFIARHGGERGAERAGALALTDAMTRAAMAQCQRALVAAGAENHWTAHAWAQCGALAQTAARAIAFHNAAPTLTLESLLLQMRATGESHDEFGPT